MRKQIFVVFFAVFCFIVIGAGVGIAEASPYATEVINYAQGSNPASGYENPNTVLGEPTRTTNPSSSWGGDVTPFNSPWGTDELFSIGAGGYITVKFDHPVEDNPSTSSYSGGYDFIVFGNYFWTDGSYPNGVYGGGFGGQGEPGVVEVSQDGVNWYTVSPPYADSDYPTLGWQDSDAYGFSGTVPTDFTKPVLGYTPQNGDTMTEIQAGYAGSGGGTAFDISSTGLDWIQYVRVSQGASDSWSTEIDGFSDVSVPIPGSVILLGSAFLGTILCRRREA